MSNFRKRKDYIISVHDGFVFHDHVCGLSQLDLAGVSEVYEVNVAVTAAAVSESAQGFLRLSVSAAKRITAPVIVPRRRAKRSREGDLIQSDNSGSEESVHHISSASSCSSVDTEVESAGEEPLHLPKQDIHGSKSGLDVGGKSAWEFGSSCARSREPDNVEHDEDVCHHVPAPGAADASGVQSDEESEAPARFRHAPGTWKVWESTWFYATKTPGWIDIKVWLKWNFRGGGDGMGSTSTSRTLTPHHYGDAWDDPWRSLLLLRSWSIWRARWQGWARAKECRLREVQRQLERFVSDLKAAHVQHSLPLAFPLLGSERGHTLLNKWVPDAIALALA